MTITSHIKRLLIYYTYFKVTLDYDFYTQLKKYNDIVIKNVTLLLN